MLFAVLSLVAVTSPAYALPANFQRVTSDLYRGARPTETELGELAELGVGLIVNLENVDTVVKAEAEIADRLGIKFVHLPLSVRETPMDIEIDRAVAEIGVRHSGKVFVHCQRGQDRTGLVVALYRTEIQGWRPKRAYLEMMKYGFSLKYARPLEIYFRERTGLSKTTERLTDRTASPYR